LSVAGEKLKKPLFFWHQGTKPAEHKRLARTGSLP
jgi:hypothetical protein